MSRGRSTRRARLQHRLRLDLPRGRRRHPGRPGPADPLERPLDAARVARPAAVHGCPGTDAPSPSALPFALIGATAAPLTWAIARDAGAPPIVAIGAGLLVAIPVLSVVYMVQPDNFSLYQPLVAGALWMGARGLKGSPRSFALAGLLAGLATLSRNDGLLVLARPRPRLRLGPLAALAGGRAPATPLPAVPARRPSPCCVGAVRPRDGAVVAAPAGGLRVHLAVHAPRARSSSSATSPSGTASPRRRRWTTCSGWASGRCIGTRVGGLVAALMIFTTLVAGFVLAPFMVIGAWARRRSLDFGPFFLYAAPAVRVLDARLGRPRPGRHVHPLGGRPRPARLHPGARGHRRSPSPGSPPADAAWDPASGDHGSSPARRSAFAAFAALAGSLFVHAVVGDSRAQVQRRRRRPGPRRRAARRTGSCRSTPSGTNYWTGRGGVVLVNDPLDHDRAASPAPTTSAGSSSTARTASRPSRPILDGVS